MRGFVAAVLSLVVAVPAQAAPMPFEVLYEGVRYDRRSHDVRVIETQAELAAFHGLHASGPVPEVDFTARRVLAFAVQRTHLCALEVAVDRDPLGPVAPVGKVTVTTHESDLCFTVLARQVRILSVPIFSGIAAFRDGADASEVYGYDVTL